MPVLVEGTALPLWGMEIDPEREKAKFKAWSAGVCAVFWCRAVFGAVIGECAPRSASAVLATAASCGVD